MAQVELKVKVVRTEVDKLQKDIDKLNNTTINIKTSQSVREISKLETATRQIIRTEEEREKHEQQLAKTEQQQARAERDKQNAINATNRAEQSRINLERTRARQERENTRETERKAKAERDADKDVQEHNKNLKQQGLLYDILGRSLSSFIARMTMYRAVYAGIRAITNGMTEALQTMKQVDDQLVSVRKVTGFDDATLKRIEQNAYKTASQYGTTAPEYMESVVRFSQAGYKELSSDLAELSTKAQIVGDMTGEVADQFLLSVDAAYKYGGSVTELSKVLDGLNEIENKNATSIEKMAEGMGIVAPVAAQMHVSVDELAASLGVITAVTQRSGTEAARALRAIYLNIVGDTKTEIEEGVTWTTGEIEGLRDVIKLYAKDAWDAAQASGGIIDPMKAIAGLAKSVKDGVLSEAELMEMVSDIGGKLRTSQLLALINNWDMYETMLAQYRDAFGSADKEVENAMDSWTRKTNVLKNTWTEFVQKSLNSNLFKKAIDSLTWIIKGLGSLENSLKIIAGFYLAAKINKLLTGIKLVSGAIETMGGGFKNTIKVLLSYRSSMHAAEVEGKALEAQQLATDAANKSLATSFTWVTAAIAVLTIAYTAYTVASNKAKQVEEERVKSIYDAADAAKESNDKILDLHSSFNSAKDGSDGLTESAKNLADVLGKDIPESVEKANDALNEWTIQALKDNIADIYEAFETAKPKYKEAAYGAIKYSILTSLGEEGVDSHSSNETVDELWEALRQNFYTSTFAYSDLKEGGKKHYRSDLSGRKGYDFSVDDWIAYRDALVDIVDKTQRVASETRNAALLTEDYYVAAKNFVDTTAESYSKIGELSNNLDIEKTRIHFVELASTMRVDSVDAYKKLIDTINLKNRSSNGEREALIALAELYYPQYAEAIKESAGAHEDETDEIQKNLTAQDQLTAAKERATAAARNLIPILFDETGQLTEEGAAALQSSSYLADLVQAEIDLQNQTNQANYARIRAELAALSGEAVRTAKALMAAYAASSSLLTLKQYALENGATPDVMKAITLINQMEASLAHLQAAIDQGVSYSGQIAPYTSNYTAPSSSSGSSGGSSYSRPSSSSSSSSSSTTKTEDAKLKALQDRLTLLKSELSLMQERGDSEADQIKKMKEIMKALHNEAEYLRSIGGDQATINNLSQEWWSYHNKIESIMDKEAEDAERQAKAIQDAVDAQIALNNAMKQRNVRIYNAATGRWEWTANPNDVNSAREAYNNAMANLSPSDMGAYNAALAQAYAQQNGLRGTERFVNWLKTNNNSGGSTHNGNNYNFGNFTFSEAQAKGISLYDLAQLARSLAIYS